MDTELRVITSEDWEAFRAVRLRALADAPDSFGVTLEEASGQADSVWRERAGAPHPVVLAFADEPVAMGGLYTPDPAGDAVIWGMWVDPAWRGRGLASRVLRHLLDGADAEGRPVSLHVTQGNDTARRLYERHGFVLTGETEPLRPGSHVRIDCMRRA